VPGCLIILAAVIRAVVGAAEGIGDALAGGIGLVVDAVSVDLEQDGDAVPGRGGRLRRGLSCSMGTRRS
jgi:hypothetical protein